MLVTSTTETDFWLLSYLNKVVDIIIFVKHFLNSTSDTQSWLLNTIGLKTKTLLQQGISVFGWAHSGSIWGLFVGPTGVYLLDFFCSGIQFYLLLSPYLCFICLLYLDLYVLGDDALIS